MWVHAGPGPEANAYAAAAQAFSETHKDIRLQLVKLPEGSYSDQVYAAALARRLPCVLDFDGPNLYNVAWTQRLLPLDGFADLMRIRADMLPSLVRQGTYNGKLYGMGQFDSGLALWGHRALLQRAGVRIPTQVADAWTLAEFESALQKLQASGLKHPLDMKFNWGAINQSSASGWCARAPTRCMRAWIPAHCFAAPTTAGRGMKCGRSPIIPPATNGPPAPAV